MLACLECNMTDNLEHYTYYCDTIKLWDKIENWVNSMFPMAVKFNFRYSFRLHQAKQSVFLCKYCMNIFLK